MNIKFEDKAVKMLNEMAEHYGTTNINMISSALSLLYTAYQFNKNFDFVRVYDSRMDRYADIQINIKK